MFKLVIPAIMASTVALAAPAAAQYRGDYDSRYSNARDYDGRHYNAGYSDAREIRAQIDQMIDRIHRAEDRDTISKREEDRLMREARRIQHLYYRYRGNGLSGRETHDLQNRIHALRQQFRFERQDGRRDGRW